MSKMIYFKIVIIFFLSGLLTACNLEGNIEALRRKPVENPDPSIPEPGPSLSAPGTPVVIASDGILTVKWTVVEEALRYEVYISTAEQPPATPAKTVSVTTTVLDGLVNKTTYYMWIKAVNENDSSDFSPRARGIPWPAYEAPATPERPVIIPGVYQLTVNWEESGGASSYEVYVNTTPSVPSAPAAVTDKTSAVINNLQNDVIYYVWVRAVNNAGNSGYSPLEAGTPRIPTVAPAAPPHPVLTAGSREIAVSWRAVELAVSYEVWFGTSDNPAQAQKYSGDITGGITEAVITSLTNETTYYVWITAKNVVGTSDFSLPANAKPSAFAVLPETPDLPTVISGNRVLAVSWQAVEGALFYEVWTGTTNNSMYAEKRGADVSGTSITLTGLVNGTTYYIWIKAKNNIGISEFSPIASGIPSASAEPPLAPQSAPTVTSGYRGLTLSWQAEEGASAYELWAGTTPNSTMATKRGNDISALYGNITGLTNETIYYVWTKAKNSKGTSGFSPMSSGTPSITPGLYRGVEKIGNQNMSASLSYISANAVSGDDFYIFLGVDESASPMSLNYSGKTVGITLIGYGSERTITLASRGSMFSINSGVTLTIDENITLVGILNNASLVELSSGNLIINNGAKISGNNGNNGGGIYVGGGGTVTMNGGTISGNRASGDNHGGGIYVAVGTVTMNGGTISGNTANISGGGIYVVVGTFTMNGGTISGNTANGTYSSYGGGIRVGVGGTFTMNGGTISGNTANTTANGTSYGGGICVGGTFTMNGGTISGNTATISRSNSYNYNNGGGGGIFVRDNGTFIMYDGTISGNTVRDSRSHYNVGGGGICVDYSGTVTMYGGTISGNTATNGGGIFVGSDNGTFGTFGTFKKQPNGNGQNSGIIYGSEVVGNDAEGIPLKNTDNGNGHAIYFNTPTGSVRQRSTTAGQTDYIDTETGRGLSASGDAPYGQ